jgi:metal-sulfur cluster biosynthetic enzyme
MELKDFIKAIDGNDAIFRDFTQDEITKIRKIPDIREKVIAVLKLIYDPEISVNIWDLGLIYTINIDENSGGIMLEMTLTSPTCPVADAIPKEVERKIKQVVIEAKSVTTKMVWEPTWNKSMMSEEARFILDM